MKAIMILLFFCSTVQAQRFRVLALAENGGHHIAYSKRAKVWLDRLAKDSNFVIDYIENTDQIKVPVVYPAGLCALCMEASGSKGI